MRFAICPLRLSKVLRLPRKSDARSYEVLQLSGKIISANLKIWCSKMQPLSGNQRPDFLTSLLNMSLVLCLPRKMHLCRSSSNAPRVPSFVLTFCSLLTRSTIPCACHVKPHLNVQKRSVPHSFLHFWLRNVLRATAAYTFSTSQLPKVAEPGVLCTFWLRNVLRATTACTFSTSQLPKVVRTCGASNMLTSKCASRHTGVQFFISHLPSWLRTRRFRAYFSTLRSHKSLEKHSASRLSYFFARLDLLSSETFSFWSSFFFSHLFDLISSSLLPSFWSSFFFSSLLFSDSSHLCFSSVHIVGSLTSKLPSISGFSTLPNSELSFGCIVRYCNLMSLMGQYRYFYLYTNRLKVHVCRASKTSTGETGGSWRAKGFIFNGKKWW